MKRILITFLLFFSFSHSMFAKIILPSVFADNMVLQQNSEVAIWGWSNPGESVKIVASWNKSDTTIVKASSWAKWSTTIKTGAAGGPYSIQILGDKGLTLNNVMLGEVWLCSGQSNMEMNVKWKLINGEAEAAKATNPNIRIFHIQKMGAEYPQQSCNATWTMCTPETMRETSATGYFFARELQQKLNVPIGIIVSAWGGTPAEVWIDKNQIMNNSELERSGHSGHSKGWFEKPGILYNSMIAPIVPFGIAGTIWYQGEANRTNYSVYAELMKTLIGNWRMDFKKNFPFYFVQIAPYDYGTKDTSAYLREQQSIAAHTIENTGMVVISDLVDNIKDIHPKDKLNVGKRLANYALSETYKQNVGAYKSPEYQSMQIKKEKVYLTFSNVLTGLKSTGKTPDRFLIAGDDQIFVPATAKIEGKSIILSAPKIKSPVAVRFCFDNTTMPDVFTTEGLPLAPFRTDKWNK